VTATYGLDRVTVRVRGETLLDSVSFAADPGSISAVVGGDGAGKTTLLRTLAGRLPVESGAVRRPDRERIGAMVGAESAYGDLTIDENLEFAAGARSLGSWQERSEQLLERAGLANARGRLVEHLSGGMRHKLALVLALLHRPLLVLADEPTTGVDPASRAELWRMLSATAAEGAAVVFSTTYLDEAERASRLLVLDNGRELVAGEPKSVIAALGGGVFEADHELPGPSWRLSKRWRGWSATGVAPQGTEVATTGLEDVVIVAQLSRIGQT
jgi:ABC-2 type transport system ATP-binding protein